MKKKPNRQIGDRAKVSKTFRLDADLVDWLEARSRTTGQPQVDIVENALNKYKEDKMDYELFSKTGFVDQGCASLKPFKSSKKGERQYKWIVTELDNLGGIATWCKLFVTENEARKWLIDAGYS